MDKASIGLLLLKEIRLLNQSLIKIKNLCLGLEFVAVSVIGSYFSLFSGRRYNLERKIFSTFPVFLFLTDRGHRNQVSKKWMTRCPGSLETLET